MKPRLAVTLGDPAGIGPEIVCAALRDPRVRRACHPILVGDPVALALHRERAPQASIVPVSGLPRRLPLGRPSRAGGISAIESLRVALDLVGTGRAQAVVTAPVSKESFHRAALGAPAHTEWLARQCGVRSVAMLMVAGPLRAILMTRHVPLAEAARRLTPGVVRESARLGHRFVKEWLGRPRPRLVACGINPHAGDGGLIGREEQRVLAPALRALRREGIAVQGPVAADAVFRDMVGGRYDLALAAYHDQGMIPLKVHAPGQLVNITLGLPFVRTSPGHGTAYDIAGRRRADPSAMIEAILLAAQYTRRLSAVCVSG